MPRLPRPPTRKRTTLAHESDVLVKQLATIESDIAALDFALRTVSPSWEPAARARLRDK